MVSGYNTITIKALSQELTLEEQKKIVTMFNSNNKPLLVRLVNDIEGAYADLTILFYRMHISMPTPTGVVLRRGYVGETEITGKLFLSIGIDDSVHVENLSEES